MRLGSRFLSFLLVLFVLVAVSTTTLFASIHTTASPKVRITSKVDNNKRTTLHRHVPTAVRNGMDMGRVEPTTPVEHLVMVLKSDEDQKREIRRVIDEQQDKHTQNYHQWATPEEFGEHFGVHDSDIENIKAWLSSQGLTVEGVNKSKRVLHFSGTIGQLEGAFHVQMHYFLMPNGETHVSNDRDITVPTALATVIGGVPTLNDFFRKSHMVDVGRYSRFKPGPKYTASTSTHYVSATDFATIYNSAPLLAQGINGTGVTIGIVGRSDILLSDVQAYRQMMGLQANDPNFIHAGQDAGTLPGDDGESDLDVEISGGMAPGATVDFVIGTPTFLVDGITNSFEYLIENNIADIISSSYGDCEGNEGAGGNLFNNQLFEQAAAQGTSVFIAAGDNGPAGCDNQSADLYEVLGYAAPAEGSTWYNIAAGGSEFDEGANVATYWSPTNTGGSGVNSALTYIPEVPWNEAKDCSYDPAGEACGELWSGSGAISAYYLQPPWQRGSGVPTSDPTLTLASGATGLWVTGINITNPGSGYTTAPTMTISGGGCLTEPYTTGAVTISGGSISSIVFPNDGTQGGTLHVGQGFGCTSAPTVAFTAAPAGGVTATATTTVGQMQNILPLVSGVPHRYTPDIALNAASGHDATFYCSEGVCELNSSGAFLDAGLVGGTSVAAPSMAGVQALINQANGGRQGMPGYIYYALSAAQSESACNSSTPPANGNTCAFHDITTGNNFICGESTCTTTTAQIGFPAKSGYDMATGLGSPNVANLASQWGSVVFNSSNATLNLSQTTFQHGASVTLSGTVAAGSGSGTPTGDVAFIVSQGSIGDTNNETTGAQNGPVAFATLSGGSYSATLNNLPGGTYYVTARYAGDENFASSLSAGVPVTVSSEPGAVTLTPYLLNGTSCEISTQNSFSYGQDTLINVNVAGVSGNGAPTGTVALTLDGNPWTTVTLDPNGNAFAYSGATGADTSCVYDYSFPSVNMIPGGSHSIGATYSGDNSVGTATATPASITVAPISPGTLTFAAAGSSTGAGVIAAGATVPLAITFPTVSALTTFEPTPGASGPTGTITFTDTTTSTIIGTATVNPYVVYENEGSSTSAVPEWLYNATAKTTTNGITASGAHSIKASYSGDTNYTSTTATSTVTVGGTTATTVAVTASANPTTLGGTPTLTATITSSPATTAGTVTFFDGTTVLGQGSTVGTAHTSTLKLSSTYPFTGGAHSITASYSGTGTTSQASTSPVFTENVTQGTMTINLTTKTTDVNGNNFSFSAFLQCVSPCSQNRDTGAEMFSNIYGPTLSVVNFYDGATLLGSAPATLITYVQGGYGDWIAQFTTPLSTGAHSITAKYSDTNYASATSNAQAITVTTAQTITWATPPPASALTGSTFTVAATGGASGNAIAYTSAGACTNSGATYTMNTGNGSCTVVATQAGNSSYAAGELSTYVAALKNAQAITFTTPAPASAEYGSSFTVAATGGASGNAVTFASAGACTNSGATYTITAGTGTCSVIANQAGNANYSAAPTVTETTSATDSNGSVSVASGLNPSTYGTSVTFTATITSDTGAVKGRKNGAKPAVVTGTVTWSANTGCSPSSISGGYPGTATCTTSSLATGSDTVTGTYGGDGNHNGGSGSVSQTVDQASTTTAVASSLNPSEYGQAVSFSATVTGASPTGTVQFYINGSLFDTETLASGTATSVSTSALTAGTYTVTATYSGDTNNTGSSGTLAGGQVVNGSNSTTTVTSTPNPSTYATSVTFTATITTDTGDVKGRKPARKNGMNPMQPTGTVTWSANTGCAASTLSGSYPGVATCTTSSATHLPVGTDVVTASYSGDSNHTSSAGSVNQVVTGGIATTIDVTSVSPASEPWGADTPVTITAVLAWTGHGVAPTAANVTIGGNGNGTYGATSCAARVHETITCTATYTPTNADVTGTYTETATFSGDTNYTASSSPETNNFTISGATSTTSVTSTPNPSVYATSVTFTATITTSSGDVKGQNSRKNGMSPMQPTGTVTWSANTGCSASTLTGSYPGVATCTTSSATHLPVGTDVVTATYSGDGSHGGSSGSVNQVVTGGIATTIDVTNVSPSSEEFGADSPVTITAVLSWTGHGVAPTAANVTIGGNGNGTYGATSCAARVHETITCTATYTPTNADVAGTYTETATFSGDTNYAASSSSETNNFSIGSNASTTSVSSGLNPSTYGGSVTFTATITSDTGDVKGRKPAKKNGMNPMQPTGTVTWSANTGCSASTLTGSYPGVATCTTSSLGGGSNTVSATYSGDSNHAGSSGSVSQTVNPASQTITFTTTAPSSEPYNGTFGVAASASSSLTVAFTAAGNCSVADNHNGTATFTMTSGAGTCTVKANQAGNSDYSSAPQATESVSATPASQTINVTTPAPATAVKSSSFTVVASATSGLPITWGSAGICTNVHGTYTMTASSGTCTVTMNAPSSVNYTAATQVTETTNGALPIAPTVSLTGPATAPYQSTYTVVATTNASTTPTFTALPATVCTVSGPTVTMVNGTGMCTVTAHWAADDVYKAATATAKTTATKVASVVTWNTPAAITYGTALSATQLDATASVPGAFVYDPASGKVLGAGTQTLSVKFTPTATSDYTTVAATTVSLVVNQANTTTAITSTSLNPSIVGHSITVHYNVASPGKATGSVTITASSGETCTGTVSSVTGDGSCIIKPETVGSITLTGTYGGDANNNGSTSAGFTQTVNN